MRELFVYYRVRVDDADAVLMRVRGLQARLVARHPGLTARVLRRPEAVDGSQTWMEVYALDPVQGPHGVDAGLQAAIEREAAASLPSLDGQRHAEVFVALAS